MLKYTLTHIIWESDGLDEVSLLSVGFIIIFFCFLIFFLCRECKYNIVDYTELCTYFVFVAGSLVFSVKGKDKDENFYVYLISLLLIFLLLYRRCTDSQSESK